MLHEQTLSVMANFCEVDEGVQSNVKELTSSQLHLQLKKLFTTEVADIISGAGIDGKMFSTLTREDLLELFPGNDRFLLRKKMLNYIASCEDDCNVNVGTPVLKLPRADFHIYSDSELLRCNREGNIGKEVLDRCVRALVSNMIASCQELTPPRFPSALELEEMAKTMCSRFPVLKDNPTIKPSRYWEGLLYKMKRRLANKKPVQKPQGPTPKKLKVNREQDGVNDDKLEVNREQDGVNDDKLEVNREQDGVNDDNQLEDDVATGSAASSLENYNPKDMLSHYQALEQKLKEKNPNPKVVSQLLDIEFPARKSFVESLLNSKDRQQRILEAYPCFLKAVHLVAEIGRYVNQSEDYVKTCAERLETLFQQLFLYGLHLQLFSPRDIKVESERNRVILWNIVEMFPTRGRKSKMVMDFDSVNSDDDFQAVLAKKTHPFILASPNTIIVASEGQAFAVLSNTSWIRAVLVLLGIHYTFLTPYPTGTETVMSFLQPEVLQDDIHVKDITKDYKLAVKKFKEFLG